MNKKGLAMRTIVIFVILIAFLILMLLLMGVWRDQLNELIDNVFGAIF